MKLKIITVLKSGGEFNPSHVYRMKEMCEENIKDIDFSFCCYSDLYLECDTVKLEHNWPGWWSKMEIYKEQGPCLYFDLDNIIRQDISDIVKGLEGVEFAMLDIHWRDIFSSSIMYWDGDARYLYEKFKKSPKFYMDSPWGRLEGDQGFVLKEAKPKGIQTHTKCEERVVSFKKDLDFGKKFNPDLHSIVHFHGQPRPWRQNIVKYKDNG